MIADSKSAIPPKVCGLGLQARLIPRTTSCAVTGRGGLVFHITPLRMQAAANMVRATAPTVPP